MSIDVSTAVNESKPVSWELREVAFSQKTFALCPSIGARSDERVRENLLVIFRDKWRFFLRQSRHSQRISAIAHIGDTPTQLSGKPFSIGYRRHPCFTADNAAVSMYTEVMRWFFALLIAVLPIVGLAQTTNRQVEAETASRIATLEKRFEDLNQHTANEKEWIEACRHNCQAAAPGIREQAEKSGVDRLKAMNAAASKIHGEVDAYIARTVRPGYLDPGAVKQGLGRILGKATWGATSAFVTSVGGTPSLVVAYTLAKGISMGAGATSVTVRVYAVAEGGFRIVSAAGHEMDGCADVSVIRLHSPAPTEMWLLLTGFVTGANGPNNEMQVYAYDGGKFRSVWADDQRGNFTIRVRSRVHGRRRLLYRRQRQEPSPATRRVHLG